MEEKLYLNDLLKISDENIGNVKIKFNQYNGNTNPMDEYIRNPDIVNINWFFWREERRYFKEGQVGICLLRLSYDIWLLTTIKKIIREFGVCNGVNYEGEEVEKYKAFFGRIVIKYHKNHQGQDRYFSNIQDKLEVVQILPSIFDGEDFPGYDKVRVSFKQLEIIINREKRDWIAALENQKAVYLITDKNNGKLYVGSATSEKGMLLQRWRAYIYNGHGCNKELVELIEKEGIDYIKENFQYSILENYNAKVSDNRILEREVWWKETLQSRRPYK